MWDIKYRPLKFSDVLGQTGAVQLLKSRLRNGTALDTSYIFSGGHGQGKTTLARILARAALCLELDQNDPEPCNACDNCTSILDGAPGAFEEKDAASGGTIDIVRSMVDDLPFSILNASKRIWLFDEAHRMSTGAQDVLLKPLEEKKVVGIFCTTEAEKIRGPIRSRCEEHTIRKVSRDEILVRMKKILTSEGVTHEDDAVLTVIDYSGGHVRDIVNRLEMIAQLGDLTSSNVRDYLNLGVLSVYYDILLAVGDSKQAIELVELACERQSPDEVAAGIAEAAMNSYRLAHGMYADFLYVDRPRAQKVFERYNDLILRIAKFLVSGRYSSRTALTCDIVSLAQGTTEASPQISVPAFVISAPVSSATPVPTNPPVVASDPAVAQPVQQPDSRNTVVNPEPAVASLSKSVPAGNGKIRSDGIGARGSGDTLALTDIDDKGVPQGMPRSRDAQPNHIPFSFQGSEIGDENRFLSADEWKREFYRTWPRR